MIFVLGLVLLIIGVPLSLVKEEKVRYSPLSTSFGSFNIPSGVENVYPYQPLAILLMFVGIILIVGGIIFSKTETKNNEVNNEIEFKPNEIMW